LKSFDFDFEVQDLFTKKFSNFKPLNWKSWLEIGTKEEYEELALELSGLSSVGNVLERIKHEETDSRSFSIDLDSFLGTLQDKDPPIFCHTSGTTDSKLSNLKWFHMSRDIIEKQWAPGMQAIFESSGLDSKSSAIIFIPSRLEFDGIRESGDTRYISLYSSEFSQRIMLSVIKPYSYTFYEYKNSRNLEIISKILQMENIAAISAPAITILGWSDINRLQNGLKNSLNSINMDNNPILEGFLSKIKREGLSFVSREIQEKLSKKLSKAALIFSTSSLSKLDWNLIRKFMKWEIGKEKFINLYVASEIGPFAASINKGDFEISRLNRMYVFPLTLPVIESKGKKELISRSKNKVGKLLVSRLNNSRVLINIDIGDIISVKNQEAIPQIDGKILRSQFQLKYPIKISNQIKINSNYTIYAGDYFSLTDFEIVEPRVLLNRLKEHCKFTTDSLLLIKFIENDKIKWKLIIPSSNNTNCSDEDKVRKFFLKYPKFEDLKPVIKDQSIHFQSINDNPVDFLAHRDEMLMKVRNGKIPKGILKKWPLYVIEPEHPQLIKKEKN